MASLMQPLPSQRTDRPGMESTPEDNSNSLLSRLRRQNGALERLKYALASEDARAETGNAFKSTGCPAL
ncbi:hypothetical protein [Aurantimonas sp. Leaf443]|uniref:hypothetical protein n=1 Tax=Aurantimonas sp. Leaf443 TaxID=1736378 RepID=UPI000B190F20|nr:hypothetical protein [Aurantimonas sp. Leaf443]